MHEWQRYSLSCLQYISFCWALGDFGRALGGSVFIASWQSAEYEWLSKSVGALDTACQHAMASSVWYSSYRGPWTPTGKKTVLSFHFQISPGIAGFAATDLTRDGTFYAIYSFSCMDNALNFRMQAKVKELLQEAQLPQRNSASAAYVYLYIGWLTDRAMYRTHASFLRQSAFWPFEVIQGHPRSMIFYQTKACMRLPISD